MQRVKPSKSIDQSVVKRVFDSITDQTNLNAEGRISWSGESDVDQLILVLGDAFDFPEEISRFEISSLVQKAIFDARKQGPITMARVLENLQTEVNARVAAPQIPFSMWTRVSLPLHIFSGSKKIYFPDASLELTKSLPNYMVIDESQVALHGHPIEKGNVHSAFLIVRVKARGASDAADKIFKCMELFTSVYNVAARSWNLFGTQNRPEAPLLTGCYYYIFDNYKSTLEKSVWYNETFNIRFWKNHNIKKENFDSLIESVRSLLNKLESHPLKAPLTSSFSMMNDGMESSDMSMRTLRYWTALERIFQSDGSKIGNAEIIRRATYADDPDSFSNVKLARLMRLRNRYVHLGSRENEHHQLTQFLASHVRTHLLYILNNGQDFVDHASFVEMTELPSDKGLLERRKLAIERRFLIIDQGRHKLG